MTQIHEVQNPIISSPYEEPKQHYEVKPGEPARLEVGRRPAFYYYRPPERQTGGTPSDEPGTAIELTLVNILRARVKAWREAGYPGATRTSLELLRYWRREEHRPKLFFCQLEAAETVIFLTEARSDMRQGIEIPRDEPGEEGGSKGYTSFTRYACKMATGSGKTMVMAMLAAWSILNKANDRSDARFSDLVLVVCPNITIRDRLQELDPQRGESSIYRTFDLVPPYLMDKLRQGKVGVTNWHILEPQAGNKVGEESAAVVNKGEESDRALVKRVMRGVFGGATVARQNILVLNDEAHHAYRLRPKEDDRRAELEVENDEEEEERAAKEATVWVSGLDKANKLRGINFCVDLSATPYYLNRTGNDPGRPFPWVVSDFGLIDAIESGLVKIPQLPIRDATGSEIPAYFNVWKWIIETQMSRAEKGGRRGEISRKAVLKYAQTPIAQLSGLWRETFLEWSKNPDAHPTPPVFIIVCRDTQLARLMYEWIGAGKSETAPPIEEFRNRNGKNVTVRVDSKVVQELESGVVKSDEGQRLRFVLTTIGKTAWPGGKPPEDWLTLCDKLNRRAVEEGGDRIEPLAPPGRDVRCIISVAMLNEGWDATTVTHIVGLRPFQSQLLCEQVVGRGLRRTNYLVGNDGLFLEEEAKVYGVPFEVIPFKASPQGQRVPPPKTHHVHALPDKVTLEIRFPRVERYSFAIRNHVAVDWDQISNVILDPLNIPPEVIMKGLSWTSSGNPTLHGPGKVDEVDLIPWRRTRRQQELEFELARTLTRAYTGTPKCEVPPQALFPQLLSIAKRFVSEKVEPRAGYERQDVFLNPYFGWAVETLVEHIHPDVGSGESPELAVYDPRGPGSTSDVDFWTSREIRDVVRSHINRVVLDTRKWEQSAAYYLDTHDCVIAFAKNSGLGFAIPYLHSGEQHEYVPDFLVRLQSEGVEVGTLILETKGHDPLTEVKKAAAERWVEAVNRDGNFGLWNYRIIYKPTDADQALSESSRYLAGLRTSREEKLGEQVDS